MMAVPACGRGQGEGLREHPTSTLDAVPTRHYCAAHREDSHAQPAYRIFGAGTGTGVTPAIPQLALTEAPEGPFLLPEIRQADTQTTEPQTETDHVETDDRS